MKLLLAAVALLFSVTYFVLGVPLVLHGSEEVTRGTLDDLGRADAPLAEHVAVQGGVLTLGPDPAAHLRGRTATVPVLTPSAAAAATEGGGFDAALARAAPGAEPGTEHGTERVFLAHVPLSTLRSAVRESGAGTANQVLGPIDLHGRIRPRAQWSASERALVQRLGLAEDEVVVVDQGELPKGRSFGVTCLVLGVLLLFVTRWAWRTRSGSAPAGARPGCLSGTVGRVGATLGGVGALALSFLARGGDDLARHGDDLARVSDDVLRHVDDLESARGLGRVGAHLDDVEVEDVPLALDLLDSAATASDLHELWTTVFDADVTVAVDLVLRTPLERYGPPRGGVYELVEWETEVQTRHTRDGRAGAVERRVDRELPDAASGEHTRLSIERIEGQPRVVLDLAVHLGDRLEALRIPLPARFEAGGWEDLGAGRDVVLRIVDVEPFRAAVERSYAGAAERLLPSAGLGLARAELDADVLRVPRMTLRAGSAGATLELDGETWIRLSLSGWR